MSRAWKKPVSSPQENVVIRQLQQAVDEQDKKLGIVLDKANRNGASQGSIIKQVAGGRTTIEDLVANNMARQQEVIQVQVEYEKTTEDLDELVSNAIPAMNFSISQAQQSANGKNRIIYAAVEASGETSGGIPFREGDTWFQIVSNQLIGHWQWAQGAWVAQKLNHQIIASVDLGTATVGKLKGRYIEVLSLAASTMLIGLPNNLLINPNFLTGEAEGSAVIGWTPAAYATYSTTGGHANRPSVTIAGSASLQGVYLGGTNPTGEEYRTVVTANESYRISSYVRSASIIPTGGVRVYLRAYNSSGSYLPTEPAYISNLAPIPANKNTMVSGIVQVPNDTTSVAIGLFSNALAAASVWSEPCVQLAVDNTLVVKGGIISDHITATEWITSKKFIGSQLILLPSTGVATFPADFIFPETDGGEIIIYGNEGQERVRLDGGDDGTFASFGSEDDGQATIGSDGSMAAVALSASEKMSYRGTSIDDILWDFSRGVVARASFNEMPSTTSSISSEWGLSELRFQTPEGEKREYRIVASKLGVAAGTRETVFRVRMTTDGTRPTIASPEIGNWAITPSGVHTDEIIGREYALNGDLDVRLLLSMAPGPGGSGTVGWRRDLGVEFSLIDEGNFLERTGTISDGNSNGSGGGGTPTPPAPTKNYDYTYSSTWKRSFMGDNTPRNVENGNMYQGQTGYWPGGGIQRSMFGGFQRSGGATIAADTASATITSMQAYLYFAHWNNGNGGTAAIGLHNASSLPSSFSSTANSVMVSSGWPRSTGRWIDIPPSRWAAFKANTAKGLTLYINSTGQVYYGYVTGAAKIRVKFKK